MKKFLKTYGLWGSIGLLAATIALSGPVLGQNVTEIIGDMIFRQTAPKIKYDGNLQMQTLGGTDTLTVTQTGVKISSGTELKKYLSTTAVLDFANTPTNECIAHQSVTLTGAAVGDAVAIGPHVGSIMAGSIYWGFVDSANTVKIAHCNLSGAAQNPGQGTFRISVYQH